MKNDTTPKRLEEALDEVQPEEREGLEAIWRLAEGGEEAPSVSTAQVDALWERLASQTKRGGVKTSFKKDRQPVEPSRRVRVPRVWAGVLTGVVIVVIGVFIWLQPISQTAPYGERLSVNLPDGSTIELNSGSSVSYPRFFSDNRSIKLNGEAYFDVVKSEHAFTVSTFNARVQVLGTSFNIKAWESGQNPASTVTLASGAIRLTPHNNVEAAVLMEPGETRIVSAFDAGLSEPDTARIAFAMDWRKGDLVFKEQKLVFVLEDIERRFGIEVMLKAPGVADKEFTSAFRNPSSSEEVIESLCHALDLSYRPIVNGYEIY